MADEFENHSCEFKNESECEEELDENGVDYGDAEKKHFDNIGMDEIVDELEEE